MEIKATASWLCLREEETEIDWNKNNWKPLDMHLNCANWEMWDWDSSKIWGSSQDKCVCQISLGNAAGTHVTKFLKYETWTPLPQQLFMASSNSSFPPGISVPF